MASSRRTRGEDHPTRTALLDAAEAVMLAEGYASVTSRRVASEAGVNNGLIHYYFGTMDEMFVALFRRAAARRVSAGKGEAAPDQPLWRLWESIRDFPDNALMTEFIALANHRPAIHAEIQTYSERVRAGQVAEILRIVDQTGIDTLGLSPAGLAVLMTGISRFLQMESAFGIDSGHADVLAAIEARIRAAEGDRRRS